MSIPRQETISTGRVRQKQRTRHAIVRAAEELLSAGRAPTVAEAAAHAGVGRTTAYRYFPTQDSLLLEIAITTNVADIEATLDEPGDPVERTLDVLARFNRRVFDEEVRYRTGLRSYLDQWLAGAGETSVREGRRRRWLETTLGGLRREVDDAAVDRLRAALGLVCGVEALVSLRDTARLERDEALEVLDWAARALIDATLAEDQGTGASRTSVR